MTRAHRLARGCELELCTSPMETVEMQPGEERRLRKLNPATVNQDAFVYARCACLAKSATLPL
jgi:hypothetical protein